MNKKFDLVQKLNFMFGRVNVDVNVLRDDLKGQVDERMASFRHVGAVDHLYGFFDGSGFHQAVVDEQQEGEPLQSADIHVRHEALASETQSLKNTKIFNVQNKHGHLWFV